MTQLFSILAASEGDGWGAVLSVISIVANVAVTIGLFYVGAKAKRIETLEEKLEARSDERIEAKFEVHAAKLGTSLATLDEKIKQISARLERGDNDFTSLGERDQAIELRVERKIAEVKEHVRDMMDERFAAMNERFDALQQAVARSMADAVRRKL